MAILSDWRWKVGIFAALLLIRLALYFIEAPQRALQSAGRRSSTRNEEVGSGWSETLDSLIITIGLVFFIVQPFILQPFYIPSGSMENTLQWTPVQDRLLAARWIYRLRDPQHGDVVVFQPPLQAIQNGENSGDDYIKRCIGLPGDIVYANAKREYFRNGVKLNEPYVKWSPPSSGLLYSYDMKIVDGKMYSREFAAPDIPADGANGVWHCRPISATPESAQLEVVPPEDQQKITDAKPEAVPEGMFLMLGDHRNNSSDGHVWGFVPRANLVGKAMCVFWPPGRIGTLDKMSLGSSTRTPASSVVPVGSAQNNSQSAPVAVQ